jgi:hypothetical protein
MRVGEKQYIIIIQKQQSSVCFVISDPEESIICLHLLNFSKFWEMRGSHQ